jgi:hypothetical protein
VNAAADRTRLPDRVYQLTVALRDGGPLDADGEANGVILAVSAPRDSFWGYAIGTLFIRFFGVFIVLGVLQLGMLISGGIFKRIQARPPQPAVEPHAPPTRDGFGARRGGRSGRSHRSRPPPGERRRPGRGGSGPGGARQGGFGLGGLRSRQDDGRPHVGFRPGPEEADHEDAGIGERRLTVRFDAAGTL